MRKAVKVLVCLSAWLVFSGCGYALELSDTVEEWHCVKEYIVPLILDAGSEDLGRMVYRDYVRDFPKGTVQIILSEGRGTGSLYVPESVRDSEGAMPAESGYRILSIAGRKSVLENRAYMPLALAVDAGDNVILTIETGSLTENEIVSFAEEILSSWRNTE
ncbi:MAG: hypothetical protein IJS39_05385 [Synergistaceae bacterium]|nr:hypothetical protein [Synergistaceae bacterium]